MANKELTSQVVTNELLRRFKNQLGASGAVTHEWDDKFGRDGAKIGDTLDIRDPVRFQAVDGPDITNQIQDVTETSKKLVLNIQKTVAFKFPAKSLTLNVDDFGDRYLESVGVALANIVDVTLLTTMYQTARNFVGVPGVAPTDLETFYAAGEALDRNSAPVDGARAMVISPKLQTKVLKLAQGLNQSSSELDKQYKRGRMGTFAGFNWVMDQNTRSHTVGPLGGAPVVAGANQTGAAAITTSGWTAAAASRLKKGDKITFEGVYAVNPVSGDAYQDLFVATLTADVASAADGTASLPIDQVMVASGAQKNVSALPANGAAISVWGKAAANQADVAGKVTGMSIASHREAYTIGMAPLVVPRGVHFAAKQQDPKTGVAVRTVSQYDIKTDEFITRADILFGVAGLRPEWACVVAS